MSNQKLRVKWRSMYCMFKRLTKIFAWTWSHSNILSMVIFDMGSRAQFLRLGDATSAVFSEQSILGSPRKISAIQGDLWNNEIPSIVPNRRCFSRRSENWLFRKYRRSGVAESQKLSPGAHVKDYHAQNVRVGPCSSEDFCEAFEHTVHRASFNPQLFD
jgi:hypothetical protein